MTDTPLTAGEVDRLERGRPNMSALERALIATVRDAWAAKDLIADRDRLSRLLFSLATREAEYRKFHDHYGADDIRTGTAWDRMRRCGDECRAALAEDEPFDAAELEGQADG